jgi:hypothetical protein
VGRGPQCKTRPLGIEDVAIGHIVLEKPRSACSDTPEAPPKYFVNSKKYRVMPPVFCNENAWWSNNTLKGHSEAGSTTYARAHLLYPKLFVRYIPSILILIRQSLFQSTRLFRSRVRDGGNISAVQFCSPFLHSRRPAAKQPLPERTERDT